MLLARGLVADQVYDSKEGVAERSFIHDFKAIRSNKCIEYKRLLRVAQRHSGTVGHQNTMPRQMSCRG